MAPEAADHDATNAPSRSLTVCIGILTYQRPDSVVAALSSLEGIAAEHRPTAPAAAWRLMEVLVIDNDRTPSAAEAVAAVAALSAPIRYVHEPTQGLAAARNRALDETTADILVFMDDDERAETQWPGALIEMMSTTSAALVGGPVLTAFSEPPPRWVVEGGYFDRPEPPHGAEVDWLRTGNLAIDLAQIGSVDLRFDEAFGLSGGEDAAFSRTARHLGLSLRWSAVGAVTEDVGPDRASVAWVTKRWRRASAAAVRAELLNDSSIRRRLRVLVRGGGRLAQGVLTVLAGLVRLQSSRVISGLVTASRGIGYLEGLVDRRSTAYGDNTHTPSPSQARDPSM